MADEDRWVSDPRTQDITNLVEHLDGVKWTEAPLPKRFHFCTPQSRMWQGLTCIERCACGGISRNGRHWVRRNERRRDRSGYVATQSM